MDDRKVLWGQWGYFIAELGSTYGVYERLSGAGLFYATSYEDAYDMALELVASDLMEDMATGSIELKEVGA